MGRDQSSEHPLKPDVALPLDAPRRLAGKPAMTGTEDVMQKGTGIDQGVEACGDHHRSERDCDHPDQIDISGHPEPSLPVTI